VDGSFEQTVPKELAFQLDFLVPGKLIKKLVNNKEEIKIQYILCKVKRENGVSNQVRLLSSTTVSASSRKA